MSRKIIRYKIVGWKRDKEIRHKRGYHTYSDVIFGWVAWIWVSISDFFAEYLHLLSWLVLKFKNHDFSPPPRIRLGPSAGAEALGPSRMRGGGEKWWFLNFKTNRDKRWRYSAKKSEILSQIHATQPKITSLYVW